ncbi:RTA1-domain-containing protein, partial [Aureobasidium melanogenum]
ICLIIIFFKFSRMSTAGWGECNLRECSVEQSIFQYRPNLAANSFFIALFGISGIIHAIQGIWYKQRTFAILMVLGCICEMIGYGGRIIMYDDPWSFDGFIMQIVCITIAPVFMTAAIYVTLYRSIIQLSPSSASFKPALYYQIFIPCDIISLVLQAVGGAMSSQSNGSSQAGVDIGLAGLAFQVFTLLFFIILAVQYAFRYRKDRKSGRAKSAGLDGRFKLFLICLSLSLVLIFIRCAYRIYELSDGYGGSALHDQGLFIALESCMIMAATLLLNIGHPGLVFDPRRRPAIPVDECVDVYSSDERK